MIQFDEVPNNGAFRDWQSGDLTWAEELQTRMRSRGLADAGRLVSPVLRPCFLSRSQADRLAEACTRISLLVSRLESTLSDSAGSMQRLRMLPAEKVLASHECDYPGSSLAASMEAVVHNGSVRISSIETCSPLGLGYSQELNTLFAETPAVSKMRQEGYNVEPLGQGANLLCAIRKLWSEKRGTVAPRIAVLTPPSSTEGGFLAACLSENGSPAKVCAPEQFGYKKGVLCAGNAAVDVVFRRCAARDLLVQSGLAHPLLRAYREGAACVVNGFKSEVVCRRALFEFLTDSGMAATLSASEAETIATYIPWTRLVASRRTTYGGEEIDLLPFACRHRAQLVLRPVEDGSEKPSYSGADCADGIWQRALKSAVPGAWLLQEQHFATETFPVMHYGDVQIKQLQVRIHAHVIAGELRGAIAELSLPAAGSSRPIALAPVFVVSGREV